MALLAGALGFFPGRLHSQSVPALAAASHRFTAPASWLPQIRPAERFQPQRKIRHNPTATTGSPRHIFWVVPAFNVSYQQKFEPLTPGEKFDEWLDGMYDPRGIAYYAFESATLEHSSSDGFCGYGQGWGGYGECFGSTELDASTSSFLGDYLFPVLMRQDPRYFRLGKGGFGRRAWHAVSRVFVTYSDSGRTVFYSSAISGTVAAAAISNLYYPPQDVGLGATITRAGLDLGNTAIFNLAAEFWPDIQRALHF